MKKTYTFIALLLLSGVIMAQAQRTDGKLTAIKGLKEINTIPSSHTKAIVDSLNYDGDYSTSIGTGAAADFGVYSFFPAATLASHATANHYILSLKLYINGALDVAAAQLRFYTDTLATAMVYSQPFIPVEGWNNVVLTSPFDVPSTGNLYIGYYINATGGFPAGCDAGPTNPNGNWIEMGSWAHLNDISPTLVGNWNIRALCGTLPTTPVANCAPSTWLAGNTPITTTVTSGTFTLSNVGSGTLTCSGITGLSAPFTTTLVPASVSLATGATKTFTFSFNPTVAGTFNKTVVIATNGGNITINLTGTGTSCASAINTFPWTESFEDAAFPPACWTIASPDGGTGWDQIADGTSPLPGWTGGTMTIPAGGGTKAAFCTYTTGGATANDQWLITPKIAVQTNQELSFYLYWFGAYYDKVDIKVSTTTSATASFTTTLLSTDTNNYTQSDWKLFKISLAGYASQSVYFAFNEHVTDNINDGAFIGIDLVKVDVTSGVNETPEELISIFPNPANDKLYIAAGNIKSVDIYNIVGENVGSYGKANMINISDLSIGNYIVKVVTDSKVITKKINISR